jgi:hypothetical protein
MGGFHKQHGINHCIFGWYGSKEVAEQLNAFIIFEKDEYNSASRR